MARFRRHECSLERMGRTRAIRRRALPSKPGLANTGLAGRDRGHRGAKIKLSYSNSPMVSVTAAQSEATIQLSSGLSQEDGARVMQRMGIMSARCMQARPSHRAGLRSIFRRAWRPRWHCCDTDADTRIAGLLFELPILDPSGYGRGSEPVSEPRIDRVRRAIRQLMRLHEQTFGSQGSRTRQECAQQAGQSKPAQDAAGDGRRHARGAGAARVVRDDAALFRRTSSCRRPHARYGARNAGPVRAAGQPAGHLAAQVGAGRPGLPLHRAGDLQAHRQDARREAHASARASSATSIERLQSGTRARPASRPRSAAGRSTSTASGTRCAARSSTSPSCTTCARSA